jgi:hypothetical protein
MADVTLPEEPDPPPLSPWAARFGVYDKWAITRDGRQSSGIVPRLPEADPRTYSSFEVEPIAKPSYSVMDNLFFAERWQQSQQNGLKTWNAGVLNSETFVRPSGHVAPSINTRPATMMQTSEASWFPCFSKKRWFSPTIVADPGYAKEDWSVERPEVWNALREIFELSTRMINLMIEEQQGL